MEDHRKVLVDHKTVLELVETNKLEQFQLELMEHHIRRSLELGERKKVQHMLVLFPPEAVHSLVWEVHS